MKCGSFVSEKGQQFVPICRQGGWTIIRSNNNNNRKEQLQLWLDVENDVCKKDVSINKHTRLYLTANCWRQNEELHQNLQYLTFLYEQAKEAQERLNQALDHQTGDRRLDGDNAMDTLAAYKDMAQLLQNRDQTLQLFNEQQQRTALPPPPHLHNLQFGHVPGSQQLLAIHPIAIYMSTPQQQQQQQSTSFWNFLSSPFTSTPTPLIGTWKPTPILP
jgi:hypothetical protein